MSFTPRLQKNILQTILLIVCLLAPSQAFSFNLGSTIAAGWTNLTTPITSFFYNAEPTIGMPFYIKKERKNVETYSMVGCIHLFPAIADEYKKHRNKLFKIATFGNKESQRNLNTAYMGGRYFLPYSVFTYDIPDGNAYYWARHSDACSVLLYGYTMQMNLRHFVA